MCGCCLQAQVPKSLLRRYDVYFKPRTKMDRTLLRSVTSQHIGCLVKLRVSCEGSWGEAVQGGELPVVKWVLCRGEMWVTVSEQQRGDADVHCAERSSAARSS